MRIGRKLLLALCVGGVCTTGVWAQGNPSPTNLGSADNNVAYTDPSVEGLKRVDANAHEPSVIYQTVGKMGRFYVAPSILEHPALPHNKLQHTPADLKSKWMWEFDPVLAAPALATFEGYAATPGGDPKNYVDVKAVSEGQATIKVTEYNSCGAGISTYFKLVATPAPRLLLDGTDTKLDGTALTPLATYDGEVTTDGVTFGKGLKFETCNVTDVQGKTLTLKVKSEEGTVPDALRKYSFGVSSAVHKYKTDNTWDKAAPVPTTHVFPAGAGAKKAVPAAGTDLTITMPAAITFANDVAYVDYIYYLAGAENRTGIVSMVSQRSDYTDITPAPTSWTSYPYERTNDVTYVLIRVKSQLKTGPVYFIPYID